MSAPRHFLDLDALDAGELRALLDAAQKRKAARAGLPQAAPDADKPLDGQMLAMVFAQPSTRTRVSFDVAMRQLGGQTLVINALESQLGRGESLADTARVLSRYVDAIVMRAAAHADLTEIAEHASVPVINGLTDASHPCQILADIMTFEVHKGAIAGRTIAWVGDGNNVAASWIHAAVRLGFTLRLACPPAYAPPPALLAWAEGDISLCATPEEAVRGADAVATDSWASMADTSTGAATKKRALAPYRVSQSLMRKAAAGALFMHCLPAHRGEEVEAEVMDGAQSVVFEEAENRVHAQKAVLVRCCDGIEPQARNI